MKKVKYPNLNDYDLSAYEELKGDILYRINGGKVMDQADMYAMQQADAHHDEETQEEILARYENTETPSSTPQAITQTTPPATNTTPQQTTALTTEEQVEMAKKDAEKKNNSGGGESSSGGGSGSGNGSGSGGSTSGGTTTNTNNNTVNNKGYPSYVNTNNKTVDANINSNKSVEEAFSAYSILSDKGYAFRLVDGSNVVHTFSSVEAAAKYVKSLEIKIPNQESNRIRAENLKATGGKYYDNIENLNTPVSDMETRHAKAVKESIKYMKFDESMIKSTRVDVLRKTTGLGNSFDSTRYVYKSNGIREFIVYRDRVGANCKPKYNEDPGCFTEPDGLYRYTTSKLTKQEDGTYNSGSYENTLRHVTFDPDIPKAIRDKINFDPADFLDHGNQKIFQNKPYNDNLEPGSAGCTICQGGQAQQNEFMKYLYMGVNDITLDVVKRIISCHPDDTYNPMDWL